MPTPKSYINIIRAFHKLRKVVRVSSYAADLYFMLLEECSNRRWENPFFIKTKEIETQLCISRPTICKARKELADLGLIQFKCGTNGNATTQITLFTVKEIYTECKGDLHCNGSENDVSVNDVNTERKGDLHWGFTVKEIYAECKGDLHCNPPSVNNVNTDTNPNGDISANCEESAIGFPTQSAKQRNEKKETKRKVPPTPLSKEKKRNKRKEILTFSDENVPPTAVDGSPREKTKSKSGSEEPREIEPIAAPIQSEAATASLTKAGKPKALITRAREIFESHYQEIYQDPYYWTAKDAKNMKLLLQKISYSRSHREKPLPVDDDSMLEALGKFLEAINKSWIMDNFTVSNINGQYGSIISEIRNPKKQTTRPTSQPAKEMVVVNYDDDDFGSIDK